MPKITGTTNCMYENQNCFPVASPQHRRMQSLPSLCSAQSSIGRVSEKSNISSSPSSSRAYPQACPVTWPEPRKFKKRLETSKIAGNTASTFDLAKAHGQSTSALDSHRRYVHSMVMAEISSGKRCSDEEWNSFESLFAPMREEESLAKDKGVLNEKA